MYCGIKRLHSFNFDPAVLQKKEASQNGKPPSKA